MFVFERKPEKEVINLLNKHISNSIDAINMLIEYIDDKSNKNNSINEIIKLEKKGDEIRTEIIVNLYEAFLPSMKRELHHSVEILNDVLDNIKHGVLLYDLMTFELDEFINEKCKLILNISLNMLKSLNTLVSVFENGGEFREHIRNIKLSEEEIDTIQHDIYKYMVNMEIKSFWMGKLLSDFVDRIAEISNRIENVSDEFQIIFISNW
jgi:predicted phosphate transport protein (TIGR00153 family)